MREGREGGWGRESRLAQRTEQGEGACLPGLCWQTSRFESEVGNLLWFPDWVALFISHRARNMPQP